MSETAVPRTLNDAVHVVVLGLPLCTHGVRRRGFDSTTGLCVDCGGSLSLRYARDADACSEVKQWAVRRGLDLHVSWSARRRRWRCSVVGLSIYEGHHEEEAVCRAALAAAQMLEGGAA